MLGAAGYSSLSADQAGFAAQTEEDMSGKISATPADIAVSPGDVLLWSVTAEGTGTDESAERWAFYLRVTRT